MSNLIVTITILFIGGIVVIGVAFALFAIWSTEK